MAGPDGQASMTRAEAKAYDRHCMDRLGIPGIVLMQHAVEGCTAIARRMVEAGDPVLVVCGGGQNGGDGYGVAAALAAGGSPVEVLERGSGHGRMDGPRGDAAIMRSRALEAGVRMLRFAERDACRAPKLIVDALFGTGLDRPLEGEALEMVRWINAQHVPVLSIDIPSGLDCDSGRPIPECVRASATATMVARKRGFDAPGASQWTGEVAVVPIIRAAP